MKKIKDELSPIYLLLAAIFLASFLIGIGIIYLIAKSVYKTVQLKFWEGPAYLLGSILKNLYQVWNVIKYYCIHIAISIDLMGNVTCGEMIQDIVTGSEDTLFGNGDVTISAATGQLESVGGLNKTGLKFSTILSKLLNKNHCINAYNEYIYDKNYKSS